MTCFPRHLIAVLATGATLVAVPGVRSQVPPASSVPLDSARLEAVARYVERVHRRLGLPGVAVGISSADGVLLARGFGRGSGDVTLDGHSPMWIGSVSKTFTALTAGLLAGEGRLDLDAPVERALPGFTMRPPWQPGSLTVRHLLHHRSGFSTWSGHDRRAQRDGTFGHLAPRGAPAGDAIYSSLNYIVLGRVIESASGGSYASAVESLVIEPFGLADASVAGSPRHAGKGPVAGHQSYFGFQVARAEPDPPRYLVPAGFVAASAHDLARYTGVLLGAGAVPEGRVVPEAVIRAVLSPMDSVGPAMGWGRGRIDGAIVYEHAGNARTSSARVRLAPARGYAISIVANTNSGPFMSATGDLLDGVAAILEGRSPPPAIPRERLLKGAILLGTLLSVGQLAARTRDWDRAGRPTRIEATGRVLVPLGVELAGGTFLLLGLPRLIGVPMTTMTEYFPDLGIALVTSATAGMVGGVFRAWTRSGR